MRNEWIRQNQLNKARLTMHITSTNVLKSALHSPLPHYQLPPDGYKMVIVVFRVGAQIPLQNFGKILIVKMSKNMQRSVHACMCMYICVRV